MVRIMNILDLKNYIKDLPDDMEIAFFDSELYDYALVNSVEVREEQAYKYTKNNPRYEAVDKKKLLILE